MRFPSTMFIISLQTSLSWTFFMVTGLLDIRTLAGNNVKQTVEIDSIVRNSSEKNESIQNSSTLIASEPEKKSRMLHKLDYSISREAPHKMLNNTVSQNRTFESKILPLKNLDKINLSKKSSLQKPGWNHNDKSPGQGRRKVYEDYYQQQEQQQPRQQKRQRQQLQLQAQSSGVEYADGYNAIPSSAYINDYRDFINVGEQQDVQNWRNSYYPSASGPASYGCSCYKQMASSDATNRQNCDSPGASFLQTLGMLGTNLWQLVQIMATSAIPFVIPILVLKLILVPIKIFKFLQLIKFLFKLCIILPFAIRVLYPAISNTLGMQYWLYSKPSHLDHDYDHSESREESNATGSWISDLKEYIQYYSNLSDDALLRSCPSKAACELGSLISTSTQIKFPKKLSKYLLKNAEGAEKTNGNGDSLELQKESAIRAFTIALGKKWSLEQCAVYTCRVIL